MKGSCDHKNTRTVIDCCELAITLICTDCNATVSGRPLVEDEINRLIKKELERYGN